MLTNLTATPTRESSSSWSFDRKHMHEWSAWSSDSMETNTTGHGASIGNTKGSSTKGSSSLIESTTKFETRHRADKEGKKEVMRENFVIGGEIF